MKPADPHSTLTQTQPKPLQMNNEDKETVSQLSLWRSVVMEAKVRLESRWRNNTNYRVNRTRNVLEESLTWGLQAGKDWPREGVNKLKGRGLIYSFEV